MNQRTVTSGVLSALLLAAALSACAPAAVGPGGATVIVSGRAFDRAVKVPLENLTASTPQDVYVTFPDCGAAVLAAYVRERGPQEGARACREALPDSLWNTVKFAGGGVRGGHGVLRAAVLLGAGVGWRARVRGGVACARGWGLAG